MYLGRELTLAVPALTIPTREQPQAPPCRAAAILGFQRTQKVTMWLTGITPTLSTLNSYVQLTVHQLTDISDHESYQAKLAVAL